MDWLARLNRGQGRVALGDGAAARVLHWAYAAHLSDNVPHRHTYFEVCLVGEYGRGEFRVAGEAHPLGPGTLFLARPGVVHQIVNTADPLMELLWVSFALENGGDGESDGDMANLARRFADGDAVAVPDADGRVAALWKALRAVAGTPVGLPGDAAQIDALKAAVLRALLQVGANAQAADALPTSTAAAAAEEAGHSAERRARLALRYIHDNLAAHTLSVAEVAAHIHVSPRHLTRLLRAFTGVAPARYIEQARLDRAALLLRRTDDPIKHVAAQVGYADVHHFTRAFARVAGRPPGAFRREGGSPIWRAAATEPEGALV